MSAALAELVTPQPSVATAPIVQSVAPNELLQGFLGFAALGLCAGFGSGDVFTASRTVPTGLIVVGGALALTGPALIVAHQFLGLRATPDALFGALVRGFAATGRAAIGLCPAMLLFSSTSGLWALFLGLFLAGLFGLGLAFTLRRLADAEGGPISAKMATLLFVWNGLVGLVALRLAWDAAWFIAGN
jgi:hypothetical protein